MRDTHDLAEARGVDEEAENGEMARNFLKEIPWWTWIYPWKSITHLKVSEERRIVAQKMTIAEIDSEYPKVGHERGRRPSNEVQWALDVLPGYGMVWSPDAEEHTSHQSDTRSNHCRLLGVVSRAMKRHGRNCKFYHYRGNLVMIRES